MSTEQPVASRATVTTMLAIDTVLIVIFAMIGVASHDGGLHVANIARVAIPFILPYLVLAILLKPRALIHNIFPTGAALWLLTVGLGPVLRSVFFNDTSAVPFILVSAGVLGVLLLGRRIVTTLIARRRQSVLN